MHCWASAYGTKQKQADSVRFRHHYGIFSIWNHLMIVRLTFLLCLVLLSSAPAFALKDECKLDELTAEYENLQQLPLKLGLEEPHFYYFIKDFRLVVYLSADVINKMASGAAASRILSSLPITEHTDVFATYMNSPPQFTKNDLDDVEMLVHRAVATGEIAIFDPHTGAFIEELRVVGYKHLVVRGRILCVPYANGWRNIFTIRNGIR